MSRRPRQIPKLETVLNAVSTPVFLLTTSRKVAFFNSGCEQLTGWSAEQVVGKICVYSSDDDPESVQAMTAGLCPPPEVFEGHSMSVPAFVPNRRGSLQARLLNFFPLKDEEGEHVQSILGIISPIEQPVTVAEESPAMRLHAELAALRISLRQKYGVKTLVCQSDAMKRVLDQISLSCRSNAAVFLRGERGVGKEHVARVIHYKNETRSRSFVPFDCRQLSALQLNESLDSALETAASETSSIEALQPGTLYLADVQYLPRDLQARVVDAFQPDGPATSRGLRLISSSNEDLRQSVEDDRVRSDLFYLLTPLEIEIPPLRCRMEDFLLLAQHFLELLNRDTEIQVGGFDNEVQKLFQQYNWPANLDELAAVIDESRAACSDHLIRVPDLPFRFHTGLDARSVGPIIKPKPLPLEPYLAEVEKEQIQLALQQCRNNKSKAAELLDITRNRLYRRIQALNIEDAEVES